MAHPPSEEQWRTGTQAGAGAEYPGCDAGSDPVDLSPPSETADPFGVVPPALTQHPFVFQHRHQLFLLDGVAGDWVLAELRFERATCRYVEVRRASYQWPREALTVLLSRMVTGDPGDNALLDRAADGFAHWLSVQFQLYHH